MTYYYLYIFTNRKAAYNYPEGSKNNQMDKCPSEQMSSPMDYCPPGLLSAWTIVRLDYCPPGLLSAWTIVLLPSVHRTQKY